MSDPEPRYSLGDASPGRNGDFDAATVPIRHAATVLIVDERPDLQVLMLRRNARSVFVGDMWVFPGGAVDPDDATDRADVAVANRTDADASSTLAVERGGIAYWVAALRETFEEAGLLLCMADGEHRVVDLSDPGVADRFSLLRDQVNDGSLDFIDLVYAEDLLLDGGGVHYVARWLTPVGPPRRYDTRFFVTAMPHGQKALPDHDEAVHHEWVRPAAAIEANASGEMLMMTPTVSMLQRLASFDSVDEALAAAATASAGDDEAVRIRRDVDGPGRIAYPADADYLQAHGAVEFGTIRWPRA